MSGSRPPPVLLNKLSTGDTWHCLPVTHTLSTSHTYGPCLVLSLFSCLSSLVLSSLPSTSNNGRRHGREATCTLKATATDDDDEDFLRHLVPCEEDRQRLGFPRWEGGYRWFRAPNVVPIEWIRERKQHERERA